MFDEFKNSMLKEFDMTDLRIMRFFLGIEVLQRSDGIYICQRKYALEVLKRFKMENNNSIHNPIVPGCKLFKDENEVNVDETLFKQMVVSQPGSRRGDQKIIHLILKIYF